jgi:hypothetical protein
MLKNQKICMIRERTELSLRRLCGRIAPDRRVAVVLAMLALFGCGSIYMTVSSIYNFGRVGSHIEHYINGVEPERPQSTPLPPEPRTDTLNIENLHDHERPNE